MAALSWCWTALAGIKAMGRALPENLRPLKLPPYSPELDPAEHLRDELREKSFPNLVFDSLDALEGHLESALREMENNTARVKSIVAWPWIIEALINQKLNKRLSEENAN